MTMGQWARSIGLSSKPQHMCDTLVPILEAGTTKHWELYWEAKLMYIGMEEVKKWVPRDTSKIAKLNRSVSSKACIT